MPEPTTDWRKYLEEYARENPAAVTGVGEIPGVRTASIGLRPTPRIPDPPDPKCPEKAFQSWVRQVFTANGWKFYHTHDSRRSDPDFPDCVAGRDGCQGVVAELKSWKGKPTEGQLWWLEFFRKMGFRTFLWRPADYGRVIEVAR